MADALTKMDRKLLEMMCNMLCDGTLQCSSEKADTLRSYKMAAKFFLEKRVNV